MSNTDKKVSQLLSATTPLSGEELLLLIQDGTSKKLMVSDLPPGLNADWFTQDIDAYGRSRLLFKATSSFLKLGEFTADGDTEDVSSEGIVVVGTNSNSVFNSDNFGYARIKNNRLGLLNTISGNEIYTFRVDFIDFYLKDDSDNKTFSFDRTTGNLNLTGNLTVAEPSANEHAATKNYVDERVSLSGTTSSRPTSPIAPQFYFDTTLNKPIWFNGTDWVDATGTVV